jgi:hypothetical protein
MKCFATNHVKKGIFLEKNAQVFLTFPSHALYLDNPTFFDVGLRTQISQLFRSYIALSKTCEKGTFLKFLCAPPGSALPKFP